MKMQNKSLDGSLLLAAQGLAISFYGGDLQLNFKVCHNTNYALRILGNSKLGDFPQGKQAAQLSNVSDSLLKINGCTAVCWTKGYKVSVSLAEAFKWEDTIIAVLETIVPEVFHPEHQCEVTFSSRCPESIVEIVTTRINEQMKNSASRMEGPSITRQSSQDKPSFVKSYSFAGEELQKKPSRWERLKAAWPEPID